MSARRIAAMLLVASVMTSGLGFVRAAAAQLAPAAPFAQGGAEGPVQALEATPPRVSYIAGDVSFWRPGADDWAPAQLNIPLAPGDVLYAGQGANVEVQIGPGAFVRAADGTQIGLDNQELDFVQFRVTSGHAALDLRQVAPGTTVEIDTPNATFAIERAGYYRVDVDQSSTTFSIHRGGNATMTAVAGAATPIAADQQVVVTGTDSPGVTLGAAPQLTAWDRWNYERTDHLLRPGARYVSPTVYGTDALAQYGTWRTVETYGPVWVPAGVPAGWVPYSSGRWIWDPRFGWTWLDDAPWGWAPYHYGRWVLVRSYWAWAPGPVLVQPVYAPALVVFLGHVDVSVQRPVYWAPLGWGEPVIPWWGRPGFIGVPRWAGWGGPRVVNNVVINRNTTVDVRNITIYKHVNVTNAVVGVPADHFGRRHVEVLRINQVEVRRLKPVRGALEVRPVAESVMPAAGPAIKPPATIQARSVVATRPPKDLAPTLRAQGLVATDEAPPVAASRLVPSPKSVKGSVSKPRPGTGMVPGTAPSVAPRGREGKPESKKKGTEAAPVVSLPPAAVKAAARPASREGAGPAGKPESKKKGTEAAPVVSLPPAAVKAAGPPSPPEVAESEAKPKPKKGGQAKRPVAQPDSS